MNLFANYLICGLVIYSDICRCD